MSAMALATIIGAVIAAGTSIIGGVINSADVDEANKIGLQLANKKRDDELKVQEANEKMNRWSMRQREKEFKFTKQEAGKTRAFQKEQYGYAQRQNFDAKNMNMVNQNAQLRSVFMNTMTRR